jgi:transcriptional regulator with XRE-family HTH domain
MTRKSKFFNNIAEICRTLRKQKGITQPELADQAGLSLLHVQNIESGKGAKIKMEHLFEYCNALDYSIQDLFNTHLGAKPPKESTVKINHLLPNKSLKCEFDGCEKPVYMAGYCFNHYRFHLLITQQQEKESTKKRI